MYTHTHNHRMYMYMGEAKVCTHIHTTIGCTWAKLMYVHTCCNHRMYMYMGKAKVCTYMLQP